MFLETPLKVTEKRSVPIDVVRSQQNVIIIISRCRVAIMMVGNAAAII